MENVGCSLLAVTVASLLFTLPARGQVAIAQAPEDLLSEQKTAFVGGSMACSQPEKLRIPRAVAKRAKMKARLLNLLRESIFDDAKGIVNLAREREIADLASRLTRERDGH